MHKLAPEKNTERKKKGTSLKHRTDWVQASPDQKSKLQTNKQKIKNIKSRHSDMTLVSFIHAPLHFLLDLELLDFEQCV